MDGRGPFERKKNSAMVHNYSLPEFRKAFHFSNYYLMLLLIAICLVSVVHL